MWLTILDYQNGAVIIEEMQDDVIEDYDSYVQNEIGHSSYYYMTSDVLE